MTVYMIRKRGTDLWYKRGCSVYNHRWVEQSKGSIWPSHHGPASVKSTSKSADKELMERVEFTLVPVQSTAEQVARKLHTHFLKNGQYVTQ